MLVQPSPRLRPGRPFLATRIPVSARTSQAWLRWFNSAFVSRLFRVASIAAMQRSLKPQSTGQHRGDPPFRRCGSAATGARARPRRFARSAWAARKCSLHRLNFRIRGEIIIILRFERRVCRWESCRMHQLQRRVSPTTRGAPLRTERLGVELPHAAPFRPRSPTQRRRP